MKSCVPWCLMNEDHTCLWFFSQRTRVSWFCRRSKLVSCQRLLQLDYFYIFFSNFHQRTDGIRHRFANSPLVTGRICTKVTFWHNVSWMRCLSARCCARWVKCAATSWGGGFLKRFCPRWAPRWCGRPQSAPGPDPSTLTQWPTRCSWLCCRDWAHCVRGWTWVRLNKHEKHILKPCIIGPGINTGY